MSNELEPHPAQSNLHQKRDKTSRIPSSEKKRKLLSQAQETSPTKKRRHEEAKPAVTSHEGVDSEKQEQERREAIVARASHKKPKKFRHQGQPQSLDPSAAPSITSTQSNHGTTYSPFCLRNSTLYLPIYPISGAYPAQGLCADHLSPLLLSYYPPLQGVILSYSNVFLSHEVPSNPPPPPSEAKNQQTPPAPEQQAYANVIESYGPYYTHLTADFLLFAPQQGDLLEGHVMLQNEGNVGLICYNFFTASIERKRLPKMWRWVGDGPKGNKLGRRKKKRRKGSEDSDALEESNDDSDVEMLDPSNSESPVSEGHFLTSKHPPTVLTGRINFRVVRVEKARNVDREQGLLSIEGTLLTEEEEGRLVEEERDRSRKADEERGRRQGREEGWMSGALQDGVGREEGR